MPRSKKNRESKKRKNGTKRRFFHKKRTTKNNRRRKQVSFELEGGATFPASYAPYNELGGKYYDIKNEVNNPSDPSAIVAVRNLPNMKGGRRRRKMMKGGTFWDTSNLVNNPFTNFASFNGAFTGSNLLTGTPIHPNPDPTIQPSFYTYNEYRPPLA